MKKISRKDFLRSAVAGATGLTVASLLGGCSSDTAVASSASSAAPAGTYTAGTYSATSKGISSDVTVTMTFDAERITDVKIDVSGETAGFGADIGDEMAEKLLTAQSAEIDNHSGATITSDAVKDAAANCIAQAKGEPVVSTAPEAVGTGSEPYTSWMTPPEEVTDFEAEYDTDVVVCGHGYAGICSCRELAEEGVDVILIEKHPEESYQAVGNEFASLNATILQKRGVPHIDPIEFYQNFMLNTQNYANQDLIMKFAQHSGEHTDWYLSELTDEDFATMTTAYFPEAEGQLRQVGALKFWPSV